MGLQRNRPVIGISCGVNNVVTLFGQGSGGLADGLKRKERLKNFYRRHHSSAAVSDPKFMQTNLNNFLNGEVI